MSPPTTATPAESTRRFNIVSGYLPGILGRTVAMHLDYYSGPDFQWGVEFEAGLAKSLSAFIPRLDNPINAAWSAVEEHATSGKLDIVGVIFIDGENLNNPDSVPGSIANLKAYIVDESVRGFGLGRKLLDAAMAFVREKGFSECRLWTVKSLAVARRMYEAAGFRAVTEEFSDRYGEGAWVVEYRWQREDEGASGQHEVESTGK
ncbi:hypothetical protein GQ53DRAFT_750780 [Thozetella sp. PMI_491]|nr:hypothetical protein GQ53DRAFT_750780 [Thozetella sp. PMI_491]